MRKSNVYAVNQQSVPLYKDLLYKLHMQGASKKTGAVLRMP